MIALECSSVYVGGATVCGATIGAAFVSDATVGGATVIVYTTIPEQFVITTYPVTQQYVIIFVIW